MEIKFSLHANITIYTLRIVLKRIYRIFGYSFGMKRKNICLFQMNISLKFNLKIVYSCGVIVIR